MSRDYPFFMTTQFRGFNGGLLATAYFNEILMKLGTFNNVTINSPYPDTYSLYCTLPFPVTQRRLDEMLGTLTPVSQAGDSEKLAVKEASNQGLEGRIPSASTGSETPPHREDSQRRPTRKGA